MDLQLKQHVEKIINHDDSNVEDLQWDRVSGGSINEAYKLTYKNRNFFIKTNTSSIFQNGFKEEALGLQFLSKNNAVTPKIVDEGSSGAHVYLILEWVNTGFETMDFWIRFAHQLAAIHRNTTDSFGMDHTNFMGQLKQNNSWKETFSAFFIENRLMPQMKLSFNKGLLTNNHVRSFEQLFSKLENLIPVEPPAAVHGDLWSGNYICNENEEATLIDPAAYYGHREIDLAMTRLFGGFSSKFYAVYQDIFPTQKGLEERVPIYNLYPLLIHLNLFGSSYRNSIIDIISRF